MGLAGQAVKESRERVRSALKNSGFAFPMQKIIINLAPANIKKNGTLYDLPIALGILAAGGYVNYNTLKNILVAGELSLNGELRAINGVISISELAAKNNLLMLIPKANSLEAAAANQHVYPVDSLAQTVALLNKKIKVPVVKRTEFRPQYEKPNFNGIKGQIVAKRILTIAAAGYHHTLLIGPPGTGKTLLAHALQSLLPPIEFTEAVETTKIYSNAGLLSAHIGLLQTRPIRSPHHNITQAGLIGGGNPIRPGEISLASNGLLILDELLEFSTNTLQALREPLEHQQITIVRGNQRLVFPAKFLLIGTTNACPCGYLGDPQHECRCTAHEIRRYQKKLVGPLLDRIDLFAYLNPLKLDDYQTDDDQIELHYKYLNQKNGLLSDKQVQAITLSDDAKTLLHKAQALLRLSARGYYKIIKVAKTISQLEGVSTIKSEHISEAMRYRWEALNLF